MASEQLIIFDSKNADSGGGAGGHGGGIKNRKRESVYLLTCGSSPIDLPQLSPIRLNSYASLVLSKRPVVSWALLVVVWVIGQWLIGEGQQ